MRLALAAAMSLACLLGCLVASCSGESTSGKPAPAQDVPAAANTGSEAPAAAVSPKGPRRFACNAIAQNNQCIEFTGSAHTEGDMVRGLCASAAWRGTFSVTGCPREGRLGACTIEPGSPQETKTFTYEKGAETFTRDSAKDSCLVGEWSDGGG